jgi:hypothetical protein
MKALTRRCRGASLIGDAPLDLYVVPMFWHNKPGRPLNRTHYPLPNVKFDEERRKNSTYEPDQNF